MFKLFASRQVVLQLILIFLIIILVMGLGLGLPALLIMSRQTDNQLHALIDQSNQTTLALIENKASQLQNLALLISERPTLNQLLSDGQDIDLVSDYLADFRKNTQIDVIVICDSQGVVAIAGESTEGNWCETDGVDRIINWEGQVWWLSEAQISGLSLEENRVYIGQTLKSIFDDFSQQTNLHYLLLQEGEVLASNLPNGAASLDGISSTDMQAYDLLVLDNGNKDQNEVMVTVIPFLDDPDYELFGLLSIGSYLSLNAQLRNIILIIVVIVSIIGTFLAVVISRRFSKPLNQLALSASAMREGDLTTRLLTTSKIWEIVQLTNALEDARISLKHSLEQLRKEKGWIENLLNSIVEGILTIDDQARITYASEAIERLTGVDSDIMLGKPVDHFFLTSNGEDMFSRQVPKSNQTRRVPVILNDREALLSISTSQFIPPEAGNATQALVIRDVTDEERVHRLMGEFIANITHEFRTPLTALSASVELLINQLPELTTPEIEQLVQVLNVGILNLQSFIDNLIEAASIEGGRFKVNIKPVEFQAIIDDAVNMVEPIATKRGVKINQPRNRQTFQVMADRRRTSQALVNLLSNAIKYSPQNSQINLSTVILGKEVMIEVSDEGKGVSESRRSQVFNRFISPLEEEDTADFGLGLGLAVVKAIIEGQSGSVGFKNREEGGAMFWITLPMVLDE